MKNKLLHKALESVDWDYVARSFQNLGLQWYGSETKVPTKKELTTDLTEIIETAFNSVGEENMSTQIVTPHWIVCVEKDEGSDEVLLEILFTPFTLLTSSRDKSEKIENVNIDKLNQRLKMALEKENYELASLIQETLDNYNTKNKSNGST